MGTQSTPCGFCGGQLHNLRCQGCGTYFTERNFSFAEPYPHLSEDRRDARDLSEQGYVSVTFDQDDQQVRELSSVQPGWFLGRRYYDLPAQKRLEEFSPHMLRTTQPTPSPSVPLEATPADFYDARNGCGRWREDGPCRTLKGVLARLRAAGLTVLDEVLEDEVYFVGYPDMAQVAAPLRKRLARAAEALTKKKLELSLSRPRLEKFPPMTALPAPLPMEEEPPLTPMETAQAMARRRAGTLSAAPYLTPALYPRPEGLVRKPQPPPAVAPWEKVDLPLRRIVWFCQCAQPNLRWRVRISDVNPYGPTDFGVMIRTIGLLWREEDRKPRPCPRPPERSAYRDHVGYERISCARCPHVFEVTRLMELHRAASVCPCCGG